MLFAIVVVFLIVYINGVMSYKWMLVNNNAYHADNDAGITFNYHLIRIILSADELPETEGAIIKIRQRNLCLIITI